MDTIASLRERIEILEEENRQLRESYLPVVPKFYRYIGLSRAQKTILAALENTKKGQVCTSEYLANCLRMLREGDRTVVDTTIKVHMVRLRRKIAPMKIHTDWGVGYWLDEETKAKIKEMRSE